jgi:hypothetical protein
MGAGRSQTQEEVMSKPTFTAWLLRQRKRDDPIGDLARDFKSDRDNTHRRAAEPKLPHQITPASLRSYLTHRGACDGAQDALLSAAREYRLYNKNCQHKWIHPFTRCIWVCAHCGIRWTPGKERKS